MRVHGSEVSFAHCVVASAQAAVKAASKAARSHARSVSTQVVSVASAA
jgi:hypothetical protein